MKKVPAHSRAEIVRRKKREKISGISANRNMDYDWCRKPTNLVDVKTSHGTHLSFDTVPWTSLEEFKEHQDEWTRLSKAAKICMKRKSDLQGFMSRLSIKRTRGMNRKKGEDPVSWCFRVIIRAYVQEQLGLERRLSNHEVASLLLYSMLAIPDQLISRKRKREILHLDEPVLDEATGVHLMQDTGVNPADKLVSFIENQKRACTRKDDNSQLTVPMNSVPRTKDTEQVVEILGKLGLTRSMDLAALYQ